MICPRCGNEWDANKSPCTRCGLVIRMSGQSGALGRVPTFTPPPKSSPQPSGVMGVIQPVRPQSSGSFGVYPNTMPPQQHTPPRPSPSMGGVNVVPKTPMPLSTPSPTPFSASQIPQTPSPFNFSSVPTPRTPRPSTTSAPQSGFESNVSPWVQPKPPAKPSVQQGQVRSIRPRTDPFSSPSVPQRPQVRTQPSHSTDSLIPEFQRNVYTPRPSRLVTDPLARDSVRTSPQQSSSQQQQSAAQNSAKTSDTRPLLPGTILRGGRYRLYELQERQEWLSSAYEAMWVAQDAQRGASQVMMCEVVLPGSSSMVVQSILRSATMALTSVGRHPHIATLSDAFSDRGRHFFVFEPVEGESLLSRMRRTGRAMQEQEVIECCLQMTEVLELLAQQSPSLIHGMIRPDHLIIGRGGSQYVLTCFSIVLAGGATQYVSGIDHTLLSAYASPELVRGVIDVRTDLFSLMATAYHTVTGSMPANMSGSIPPAQRLNPNVSPQLDAILSKGLRPIANQRYQRPSELRQELLAMRSVNGTLVPEVSQRLDQPATRVSDPRQSQPWPEPPSLAPDSVAQTFQSLAPAEDLEEQKSLLPRPEELPPLEERNDILQAAIWLGSLMVGLILVVFFSRGFF